MLTAGSRGAFGPPGALPFVRMSGPDPNADLTLWAAPALLDETGKRVWNAIG